MAFVVEGAHVQYGRSVRALQGTSLEVCEGETVAIVGHNGAGKSTLLKAMVGMLPLTAGEISFHGVPVVPRKFDAVKHAIAYVPEQRGIFASLSVGENLRLGATPRKDKQQIAADIERELDRFPILRRYWGRGASLLSGGEQQQLAIARALMLNPRVLILDEPTLGLAPIIVDTIFDVVEQLKGDGLTQLVVEQNAVRAMELADRTYVLASPGRVVGGGTLEELSNSEAVVNYLGFTPGQEVTA